MIKKVFYSVLFLCCLSLNAKTDKSSQTFLFTRPCHQNIGLSQVFWYGVPLDKDHKTGARVDAYYQKSWKADRIRHYFLMKDKAEIKFHDTDLDKNVRPQWFRLPPTFHGKMTFAPEQKQIGGNIEIRHMTGPLFGFDLLKDWWVQLTLALADVKNNLNLTQSEVRNAGDSTRDVYDIVTAFNNPEWDYLKVNGERSRRDFGLSEVRFTMGTTFISNGRSYASSYSAISLPGKGNTSNKYMFDSQVGFNKHVGVVWGLNLQAPLTRETTNYLMTFNINLENNFLIRNHQYRTFDLKYPYDNTSSLSGKRKEWSRYLLMRKKDQTENKTVPGVNVLTHNVRVSPHAIVDFTTSLRLSKGRMQAEIGYGIWAYGGDAIRITNPEWKEEYGIAGDATNRSASASTIKTLAANDATFVTIKERDLDFKSASMLPVAVHRFHVYTNLRTEESSNKMHLGLGGFVELPRNETKALATYGVWFNAGGSL